MRLHFGVDTGTSEINIRKMSTDNGSVQSFDEDRSKSQRYQLQATRSISAYQIIACHISCDISVCFAKARVMSFLRRRSAQTPGRGMRPCSQHAVPDQLGGYMYNI